MNPIERYSQELQTWSDIQGHLPTLFEAAKGKNVLELGVRSGVSTAAFLASVQQHGGRLTSVDIDPACVSVFHPEMPGWTFVAGSSIDRAVFDAVRERGPFDIIFIDTLHTHEHVKAELELWFPLLAQGGRILIHDVETFPGARKAFEEFCQTLGLKYRIDPGFNGLGVTACR